MNLFIAFAIGAAFGAILVLVINYFYQRRNRALAQQLVSQAQAEKHRNWKFFWTGCVTLLALFLWRPSKKY